LVEFALILPLLVVLILGMFTGGIAYNQKQQVTFAAREGARYGATVPAAQAFSNADTWAENVQAIVVDRSDGDLEDAQVCVALVQGSPATVVATSAHPTSWYATGGAPCDPDETYPVTAFDEGRRVQVRVAKPARIQLGVLPDITFTMTTQATAKSESSL
jgi:Flp pilus assembly protein TadG